MLPFLCLVVLCGVLTQNAQGYGNPLAIASLSPELLQQLISHQMNTQELKNRLQGLPLEDTIKKNVREGNEGGFLSKIPLLGGLVNNVLSNIVGLKINNVQLLKLDIGLDEKEAKIIVTIPADIELELKLPIVMFSRLLRLNLNLDVQVGVQMGRDPATGHVRLVIGNCQNTPGHLRITVLDDNANFIVRTVNNVVRQVTNVLEKTVPHLLQKELCPLVNGIIQNVLDLLQAAFNSEMLGERVQFLPESFDVHDGSFNLGYQGLMQRPGGQRDVIRPDSVPLSAVPLHGSSMNMVLSRSYLSSTVRALLPPQSFNFDIATKSESAAFRQQIAAVLPEASNMRMLQIASGVPSLSLTEGKIQMWQSVEVRFFTEHLTRDYRPSFILRFTLVWNVYPSVVGEKLVLTLQTARFENLHLVDSDRHFDAQRMANIITQLLSNSLLPHQNKRLAEGIPLPLVQTLGLRSLRVTVGPDAIVIVPSGENYVSA